MTARVGRPHFVEGFFKRLPLLGGSFRRAVEVVEIDTRSRAASLQGTATASVIHEDLVHRPRGPPEKLRRFEIPRIASRCRTGESFGTEHARHRLVDDVCRAERVAGPLVGHQLVREPSEPGVSGLEGGRWGWRTAGHARTSATAAKEDQHETS